MKLGLFSFNQKNKFHLTGLYAAQRETPYMSMDWIDNLFTTCGLAP